MSEDVTLQGLVELLPPRIWYLTSNGQDMSCRRPYGFLFTTSAHAQAKPELRIGYQKSASLFVLQRAQGTLEKRLAALGGSRAAMPQGPMPQGAKIRNVQRTVRRRT